jgi:CO/xanthine dehydrogenase FAD-binding subunit
MKSAPFDYVRADSLEQACALLAQHGDDAKVIAGGQSLVPMLAMRLLAPAWLIDVAHLSGLKQIAFEPGQLVVGAGVRQSVALASAALAAKAPLVGKALKWVGHAATRNRGTVGGSLVHADPAAELPLAATLLDATLNVHSVRGSRSIAAHAFFTGPMMTAIAPDECLVDVRFPIWQGGRTGSAFDEISSRHGDFAIVSAAAQVALDALGRCTRAALAIGGAGPAPRAFPELAARLVGSRMEDELLRELGCEAAALLEPTNDLQASVAYRRHLAAVLAGRVLRSARNEASTGTTT